ncbi:N-acetyl sugar amidotransferase [Sphingomonas sp. AR_OL41]|uniref:N-acetyl sugar amidotransferase n=1 Tax=Sphingomonas sp. AR_OL41 TaxID=3042729 RepID=UPI002480F3C2|nr:N-acetyl sugar amidotransferase [Sphingomonas sp. AR_OL41]MDH7974954.1 N-acetyl sugar amidotransferase [Sphingomonas sp. AR_OL41]
MASPAAKDPIIIGTVGRMCTVTVMDESDPDIRFEADGACHYVREWQAFAAKLPTRGARVDRLAKLVARIKADGRNKRFDSVLGLSGGVDSSYAAWITKDLGLRPLIVHFDNGWNNELAVNNIENIVSKLDFELHTVVMNWPEFRDIQRAYFRASVVDLEVPTDHMILGALHRIAAKHRVRHILSGTNNITEWLLPRAWYYRKFDEVNIRAIHKKFGELPLKHFPAFGLWQQAWYQKARRIESTHILDLVDYDREKAKALLIEQLGWRDYGGKHHESVFTRFYQGYILPRKFGIDKRKAHLSQMILAGQMTRDEALVKLAEPTYTLGLQQSDKTYVAKKLGFSDETFEKLLNLPNVAHEDYGTDLAQRRQYFSLLRAVRPVRNLIHRSKG